MPGPVASICTILPLAIIRPGPKFRRKDRQRQARQDWVLMRVATVVLILGAVTFMVIMVVIIATRS